jgi:hypothetical protein
LSQFYSQFAIFRGMFEGNEKSDVHFSQFIYFHHL